MFLAVHSQQVPGKEQSQSILISYGTIHLGNGDLLENAFVGFDEGRTQLHLEVFEKIHLVLALLISPMQMQVVVLLIVLIQKPLQNTVLHQLH